MVLRTICKFPICTPAFELHMAFPGQHSYDYVMKLGEQEAELIQIDKNAKICDFGIREVRHRKKKYFFNLFNQQSEFTIIL
jgi:hypothetical protein